MTITKQTAALKLIAYLRHELSLEQLVDWAEFAMMEGDFDANQTDALREIVSRLGLADVKAFGLTWEDCENFLNKLGYYANIEISPRDHF